MILVLQSDPSNNVMGEFLSGLEDWCKEFNNFCVIFFGYLKYILVFILLSIAILTFMRLRSIYLGSRIKGVEAEEDKLKRPRLIMGCAYTIIAFGILFNYLIYFLMWALDPLPDRLIFNFLNFHKDLDPNLMNRIEDIDSAKYAHEKSVYYCIAYVSFGAILDLVISIWYLINKSSANPKSSFTLLIGGLAMGIFAGFTTCLPLFL